MQLTSAQLRLKMIKSRSKSVNYPELLRIVSLSCQLFRIRKNIPCRDNVAGKMQSDGARSNVMEHLFPHDTLAQLNFITKSKFLR